MRETRLASLAAEEGREEGREEESEEEAPGLWAAARGGGGGGGGGGAALGAAVAEVLPAEVSLHLTGPALVLHASCASSSAVRGIRVRGSYPNTLIP